MFGRGGRTGGEIARVARRRGVLIVERLEDRKLLAALQFSAGLGEKSTLNSVAQTANYLSDVNTPDTQLFNHTDGIAFSNVTLTTGPSLVGTGGVNLDILSNGSVAKKGFANTSVHAGLADTSGTFDTSVPVTVVATDPSEKLGDPVQIQLDFNFNVKLFASHNATGTFTYSSSYKYDGQDKSLVANSVVLGGDGIRSAGPGPVDHKVGTISARIGDTFTLTLSAQLTGQTQPLFGPLFVNNVGWLVDVSVDAHFKAASPDLIATFLNWNTSKGGVDFKYKVDGASLDKSTSVKIYWSDGTILLGKPIFDQTVPAGAEAKEYGPINVPGSLMKNAPPETTHLVIVADPENLIDEGSKEGNNETSLKDVVVTFGPDANPISPTTLGIVKDTLRFAGQSKATISSTSRSIEDQARVMFEVLEGPLTDKMKAKKFKSTLQYSYALYNSNGDLVLDVYVASKAAGRTATQIKSDMADKIREIKKTNPSAFRHTSDPDELQVVDISPNSLTNPKLVVKGAKADSRISRVLHPYEAPVDNAIHLEIPQR